VEKTVVFSDGRRHGVHFANRLPDGREVDLTREQPREHEHIQRPVMPRGHWGLRGEPGDRAS